MARKQDWFNPYHVDANGSKKKPSRTCGKDKGGSCVTTPLIKTMCKRNRSHKHKSYDILGERFKKFA